VPSHRCKRFHATPSRRGFTLQGNHTGAFTQDGAGSVLTSADILTTNDAVSFLRAVKDALEDPARLLLEL